MIMNFKKAYADRWWNPLSWLLVFIVPLGGILAGAVAGILLGALIGYERGIVLAQSKINKIISTLP